VKTEGPATAALRDDAAPHGRRRLRVPTPVLVTVAGALISVWIAPAFAHQWEDRGRARDLKVSLAEEMIVATHTTLGDASRVARAGGPVDALFNQWEVDGGRIGTKLSAYFGPELATQWLEFRRSVVAVILFIDYVRDVKVDRRLTPAMRVQLVRDAIESLPVEYTASELDTAAHDILTGEPVPVLAALAPARGQLVDDARQVIVRMLDAEPQGYSTTRGDLLRDLLP